MLNSFKCKHATRRNPWSIRRVVGERCYDNGQSYTCIRGCKRDDPGALNDFENLCTGWRCVQPLFSEQIINGTVDEEEPGARTILYVYTRTVDYKLLDVEIWNTREIVPPYTIYLPLRYGYFIRQPSACFDQLWTRIPTWSLSGLFRRGLRYTTTTKTNRPGSSNNAPFSQQNLAILYTTTCLLKIYTCRLIIATHHHREQVERQMGRPGGLNRVKRSQNKNTLIMWNIWQSSRELRRPKLSETQTC